MKIANILVCAGLIGVSGAVSGCEWIDRADADRHEKKAEQAAKNWNFGKMIDEGKKADKADKAAKSDPLP